MSYIIPQDECSLTDIKNFKNAAIDAGMARSVGLKIVTAPDQLVARGFENIQDAGTVLDQWRTAALAVIGTEYSCFQAIPTVALPANKLVVFYGAGVEDAPMPVSLLRFRLNAIAGNVKAVFDLEQLINSLTGKGFFSQPVVMDPNTIFAANVVCRIAIGVFARVQLAAFVLEPVGGVVA